MDNTQTKQARPFWLMLSLSIIIIIFGIVTICSPSVFWKFMDIILGFFLFIAGISAVINAFKNKNSELAWLLGIGGCLLALLGLLLIFSWSQLVGTITIWMFALWALIRGAMLIIFGISNKESQPLRWAIIGLGGLLFVLAIIIICVPKSESRIWAGICIGISTVLDGISLLLAALKLKNNPSLQNQIIVQANQNEISQGNVVISETTVTIQTNQNEQTSQNEQTNQNEQTSQTEQTNQNEQGNQNEQVSQNEQANQSEQANQNETNKQPE